MDDSGAYQASLGKRLLEDGWRQCSLFIPSQDLLPSVPTDLAFDPSLERLMLVTQSCSICGVSKDNERFVEAMVVQMLPKILPAHGQARKGAMVRELVLALSTSAEYEGIRCDIDRRCFLPRKLLAGARRDEACIAANELAAFQGWMAKYYARVAIPTALVDRFKRSGFQDAMKAALKKHFNKNGTGRRVHEAVDRIFIYWEPDDELPPDGIYRVSLIIACATDSEELVEEVDRRILAIPHFSNDELSKYGVEVGKFEATGSEGEQEMVWQTGEPDVVWLRNLGFDTVNGFRRLGTWDELTGLEDYASTLGSE